MSTAYAALLSSSMAVPFLTPTIKTFNELAKAQSEGRIKIMAHETSLYYQMIKVSKFVQSVAKYNYQMISSKSI
jgi:hypothetical protein